ncbi:GSCOCG00011313001-RA-CDS, partial [Cotesia congregata]
MMSSVWFGTGKLKNMNAYLTPFVTEVKELLKNGFTYTLNGQTYKKRVFTLMVVCDSVARPLVQCTTQFNGNYGCGLCLYPGESIEKGQGFARVYPVINGEFFGEGLRSHEQTLIHTEEKTQEKKKRIKRKSILCDIPNYDIIKNLDVDWMHCVALGVSRQFANLWFDSKNSGEAFYFGDKIDQVDSYIHSLSPTSDFSRIPRGLKDRVHMKAHELVSS